MNAADLVATLGLEPHPEGGWYREVYRSAVLLQTARGPRAALTSIYFLLEQHQYSRWHVVTSDEIWHHAGGAPLELLVCADQQKLQRQILGPPQPGQGSIGVVAAGHWQAARSLGDWSLVGCDVAPGFDFEDFAFVSSLPECAAAFSGELAQYRGLL